MNRQGLLPSNGPATQLGIGVVSRNVVESAIELANQQALKVMLIASRRQVDRDELGGGYVEGWDAHRFAEFVRARDTGNHILLCRDHGGPWQNDQELSREFPHSEAMTSAMASYKDDMDAGFSILHIDPSISPSGTPDTERTLADLKTLYVQCHDYATSNGHTIEFEVGTEEQDNVAHSLTEVESSLATITGFCRENNLPQPLFVVVQTGTKVVETRNIGSLGSPYRVRDELPYSVALEKALAIASRHGVMIKQHNTDYLSDEVLSWHPELGIHAANVAPEFGVIETRALVNLLDTNRQFQLRDRFLEMAYESGKWKKWMLSDTTATDRDRAIICGHYLYSKPAFKALTGEIGAALSLTETELNARLKIAIKNCIQRYIRCFRLKEIT